MKEDQREVNHSVIARDVSGTTAAIRHFQLEQRIQNVERV
jgi:hypothetical protein